MLILLQQTCITLTQHKGIQLMKISDKLSKIDDSITIQLYDNGFLFEVTGRNEDDDWSSVKIICHTLEEVSTLLNEATALGRA